jgi:hypothetical protein
MQEAGLDQKSYEVLFLSKLVESRSSTAMLICHEGTLSPCYLQSGLQTACCAVFGSDCINCDRSGQAEVSFWFSCS